jgi:hypothetical protein
VSQWLGRGEVAESCRRLEVDKSFASKMLKGKTTYPNVELLADLKQKAEKNYERLKLRIA